MFINFLRAVIPMRRLFGDVMEARVPCLHTAKGRRGHVMLPQFNLLRLYILMDCLVWLCFFSMVKHGFALGKPKFAAANPCLDVHCRLCCRLIFH